MSIDFDVSGKEQKRPVARFNSKQEQGLLGEQREQGPLSEQGLFSDKADKDKADKEGKNIFTMNQEERLLPGVLSRPEELVGNKRTVSKEKEAEETGFKGDDNVSLSFFIRKLREEGIDDLHNLLRYGEGYYEGYVRDGVLEKIGELEFPVINPETPDGKVTAYLEPNSGINFLFVDARGNNIFLDEEEDNKRKKIADIFVRKLGGIVLTDIEASSGASVVFIV